MKNILLVVIVAVIAVVVSYGGWFKDGNNIAMQDQGHSLDDFLVANSATDKISEAYRFAQENPDDVLENIPCYCGCMETNDHKDNRDCFIEEDGAFDEMGLNCGVCVGTALEVKAMKANNASLDEMKKAIDDKYLS